MAKSKRIRNFLFQGHRYLGLVLGIIIAIAGLTGSAMIVLSDTKEFFAIRQMEVITPEAERLSLSAIVDRAKIAYQEQKDSSIETIEILPTMFPNHASPSPTLVTFISGNDDPEKGLSIMVNPYTGKILGEAPKQYFYEAMLNLHTNLFAGAVGTAIMGITALLGSILAITGVVLWSGWRKLPTGFKIKWNAHQKRLNFDLHKVAGILASVFLIMTLFTGFIWNFGNWTVPAIYSITSSKQPVYPVSKPIPGQTPLAIDLLLEKAEEAMPGGKIEDIEFSMKPQGTFGVSKKFPGDISWPRYVMLDQYSGEVLDYENPPPSLPNATPDPRGMEVQKMLVPMHFGTWTGWSSRFIYFCVGLAPTILLITGFTMYRLRRRPQAVKQASRELAKR
jgi:uncharacterized iron-regulated membrane protein